MRKRLTWQAECAKEGLFATFKFGRAEWIWRVMNASGKPIPTVRAEQQVALDEEEFERAGLGKTRRSKHASQEARPNGARPTATLVAQRVASTKHRHRRLVVGKVEEATRDATGQRRCSIQAEEPDAGSPRSVDVGAHVGLGHRAVPRKSGQAPEPNAFHAERHQPEPGLLLPIGSCERVEFQPVRNVGSDQVGLDREMKKEQVPPPLTERRPSRRAPPFGDVGIER